MLKRKQISAPSGASYREGTAIRSILQVSVAAAWIGMMSASSAFAAPPTITEWDATFDTGFMSSTMTGSFGTPVTGSDTNAALSLPSKLSWGDPYTPENPGGFLSAISIESATNGHFGPVSITTGNPLTNTVTFTHDNFSQKADSYALTSAVLKDQLTLNPTTPAGPYDTATPIVLTLTFNINFVETPNGGSHPDDIFVIDVAGAGFNPTTLDFTQQFPFDGNNDGVENPEWYVARLHLMGLKVLTDSECSMASASSGCIGFTTPEDQSTTFQASFGIDHLIHTVPEPAPLAIFGLGLAGLGFLRRRRKV